MAEMEVMPFGFIRSDHSSILDLDAQDIFSRFFGGSGQRQQERRGPNMVTEVVVDLKDIYVGKTFDVCVSAKHV